MNIDRDMQDDESKAFARVIRMVNASEQSSLKVREKLTRAGFSEGTVERVLERAIDGGLIDDRRYMDILIRSAMNQNKGMSAVEREAEKLGIDLDGLDAWQEYEEQGDDFDLNRALEYLEIHPPRSKNLRDGAFRKLMSRGFPVSIASDAARRWSEGVLSD